jgi:ABC-type polysaccharide/polyol phosphate transport system ATPase subunit
LRLKYDAALSNTAFNFLVCRYSKVTPTNKELLKNINLGMYLGAKIGILGGNGRAAQVESLRPVFASTE